MNAPKIKIARGSELLGEHEPEQIREFLVSGSLRPTDLFWNATANDWLPLSEWRDHAKLKSSRWNFTTALELTKCLLLCGILCLLAMIWWRMLKTTDVNAHITNRSLDVEVTTPLDVNVTNTPEVEVMNSKYRGGKPLEVEIVK